MGLHARRHPYVQRTFKNDSRRLPVEAIEMDASEVTNVIEPDVGRRTSDFRPNGGLRSDV